MSWKIISLHSFHATVLHVWSEQEDEETAELEIDQEVRELMAVWEVYAS